MGNSHCTRPKERWTSTNIVTTSEPGATSWAVLLTLHWRHLCKACWWAEILKDWPSSSILPTRDGRRFQEISCYRNSYRVRHHVCTCYMAASIDQVLEGTSGTSCILDDMIITRRDDEVRRSPAMATTSWFKSKQGKVWVLQGEDNLLWTWYWQQWPKHVSGEKKSSFESTTYK